MLMVVDSARASAKLDRRRDLRRLLDSHDNSVARLRRCDRCANECLTVEMVAELPDEPATYLEKCGHEFNATRRGRRADNTRCLRDGLWAPVKECDHVGTRCARHRCDTCVRMNI